MNRATADRLIVAGAGTVIVALTIAAFWLSYAHLADIAMDHGLSGARAWAWPGCLDLGVIAGELLMLRAAIQRRTDWWAIGLTVTGSGGSIALNVAGVGADAEALDYVVAAVPPSAALIAFGVMMRQVHRWLAHPEQAAARRVVICDRGGLGIPSVPNKPQRPAGKPRQARKATAKAGKAPARRTQAELLTAAREETAGWPVADLNAEKIRTTLRVGPQRARALRDTLRAEREQGAASGPVGVAA
ncbi:DUF2637 domain-containing protein [Streptomyces sp. SBT349]|uniref:DUF2637 domain-containing protein n=1 Tax=Streptomyces sp. SBT349 TaxID=1580539 RepID=UPI00069D0664|nr:DUF2637 domain-containing protein [Streptomyces sp. SBT349]